MREAESKDSLAPSIKPLNSSAVCTLGETVSNKSGPNFYGKRPINDHEVLLERLRYLAYTPCKYWEVFQGSEAEWPKCVEDCEKYRYTTSVILAAMIRELVIRICDTVIPEKEVDRVRPKMINSLQRIKSRVGKFSQPAERDVEKTITWIHDNYPKQN